ncbi:uncharacterized protein BO80DRAFT_100722 [Aspergillus ibericus CBS 121593]|uniref:Uncharacterized protein n=1 Tax=Aspergillus ibericus CBS 121593 TaxID=1448316 RepID=A0A395GYW4_9EURO|nr:hypothetical protein BO80DRAFT_100722 [Aspergillus ibericus CBS 121593]RAL00513.1 hypothetical protein BO80DRAFT_100722 [Aspergillus ibericus CBS 121593]
MQVWRSQPTAVWRRACGTAPDCLRKVFGLVLHRAPPPPQEGPSPIPLLDGCSQQTHCSTRALDGGSSLVGFAGRCTSRLPLLSSLAYPAGRCVQAPDSLTPSRNQFRIQLYNVTDRKSLLCPTSQRSFASLCTVYRAVRFSPRYLSSLHLSGYT